MEVQDAIRGLKLDKAPGVIAYQIVPWIIFHRASNRSSSYYLTRLSECCTSHQHGNTPECFPFWNTGRMRHCPHLINLYVC